MSTCPEAASSGTLSDVPALLLKFVFTAVGAKVGTLVLTTESSRFVPSETGESRFEPPLASINSYESTSSPATHFSLRTSDRNHKFYFGADTSLEERMTSYQIGGELSAILDTPMR